MAGACSGLKVLEIARGIPGALAAMVLGDHGADVVKVEGAGGDPYLSQAGARLWSRSKQRIALDLDDPAQRERVRELARQADVVIVGLRPATAERWGLTYENLARDNPGLIFASITGFGWNGPHRDEFAVDGMVHALAGSMASPQNGGFRTGPIFVAPRMASYAAAQMCVQGVLAALYVRQRTGRGQHVDASLLQGLLCFRGATLVRVERHQEEVPGLPVARDPRGARPLFNLVQCGDGRWLGLAAFTRAFCERALEAMGMTHLLADPRFAGMPNAFPSDEARWELLDVLWDAFAKRPRDEWMRLMEAHGAPCEPVLNGDEFRLHPQLWANDLALRVEDPVVGTMVQPGVMGHLAATPGAVRPAEAAARPAPAAGDILQRWSASGAARAPEGAQDPAAFARGPLTGVKVLDFTAFLAGPKCSQLLTDLGAEMTKIEPLEGDGFRIGSKASFMVVNRGKRGAALDMKDRTVRSVVERLVRETDVVVYNFRLGVEDRLGLDDATLRRLNPNIIVCRLTAFGPRGEQAHRPAYDTSLSSLSGVYLEQAGEGNPPAAMGMADISSGIATATAILLALRAKDAAGQGQAVDTAMIGAMAYSVTDNFPDYAGCPPRPAVDRGQHGTGPLYRLYPTQDGWLFLAAVRETHRAALRRVTGLAELDDEGLTGAGGGAVPARLTAALEAAFAARPTGEWLAALQQAGVPCADPAVDLQSVVMDTPQLAASDVSVTLAHPRHGRLTLPGPAVRLSLTPCRITEPEPLIGQHTEEVLREAGLSPEEIAELLRRGVAAVAAL